MCLSALSRSPLEALSHVGEISPLALARAHVGQGDHWDKAMLEECFVQFCPESYIFEVYFVRALSTILFDTFLFLLKIVLIIIIIASLNGDG